MRQAGDGGEPAVHGLEIRDFTEAVVFLIFVSLFYIIYIIRRWPHLRKHATSLEKSRQEEKFAVLPRLSDVGKAPCHAESFIVTVVGGRPAFAGRCPAGTSPSVVSAPCKGGSPQITRAVEKARTSSTAARVLRPPTLRARCLRMSTTPGAGQDRRSGAKSAIISSREGHVQPCPFA